MNWLDLLLGVEIVPVIVVMKVAIDCRPGGPGSTYGDKRSKKRQWFSWFWRFLVCLMVAPYAVCKLALEES